jgi:hypothetical protein
MLCCVFISSCYYDKEELLYPQGSNTCDTTSVTYSGAVTSILNTYCVSCHSGTAPSGSISLNSYTAVKAQVTNGKLMGSINHASGFSPMPKNASKLSSCNISKIQKWVNAGSPNN